MNWLYPKVKNVNRMTPYVVLGGVLGGSYGAIHDQLSYTISNEYFTCYKFYQFAYADFGFSDRVFVIIIGFISTLCVGWIFARIRFYSDAFDTAHHSTQ